MFKNIKVGKIVIVLFITILIWVWADLAQDEELTNIPAVVMIDDNANPRLWVRFEQGKQIDVTISVIGPHSSIVDLERSIRQGEMLEFSFNAAQEFITTPGIYPLNLMTFLEEQKLLEQKGLRVSSCEPQFVQIEVDLLVEKDLSVRCVDEIGNPIIDAIIEPATVSMFVPEKWNGPATIQLSQTELKQSRSSRIKKTPYVEINGQRKNAAVKVEIKTPDLQERLTDYSITTVTLGFVFSPNRQGKYQVELLNSNEVMGAINIKATSEAKLAYESQRYQVILEIDDDDVLKNEPIRRELKYYFPPDFVEREEIILNQQPDVARFNVLPIETEQ